MTETVTATAQTQLDEFFRIFQLECEPLVGKKLPNHWLATLTAYQVNSLMLMTMKIQQLFCLAEELGVDRILIENQGPDKDVLVKFYQGNKQFLYELFMDFWAVFYRYCDLSFRGKTICVPAVGQLVTFTIKERDNDHILLARPA